MGKRFFSMGFVLAVLIAFSSPAFASKKPVGVSEYNGFKYPMLSRSETFIFKEVLPQDIPKKDFRLSKIKTALSKHENEKPAEWSKFVEMVKTTEGDLNKLVVANKIINHIPYVDGTDGSYFHPKKLFERGGVCKDFVIAKYLLLKEAGFSTDNMRIISLTPNPLRPDSDVFHVVLAVKTSYPESFVLDLKPSAFARQELIQEKTSKKKILQSIKEKGIDLEKAVSEKYNSVSALSNYIGGKRGIAWVGNELGNVHWGSRSKKSKPSSGKPSLTRKH